ncbi:META domain-containing protein [Streptomyces sp. NBC_00178]|uniref:META domain-containing protein n=1 Tax=Streptomyces sp. NBC_00178 TaxID=2975672 RepID=UPI002E2C32DC|nr:META domain-containing protein [Streptomyces sp. NBC_00178]
MAMRTQRMPVSVLALVTTFTLAACGSESGSGAASGDSGDGSGTVRTEPALTGVHWNVSSLTVGGKKRTAPAGAHVEIGPGGKATGSLGCNRFTADVRVDGSAVTVGQGTTTEMACADDVQEFEDAMGRAFRGTLEAAVTGRGDARTLTLTTAQGDSIALRSEPPAALTGTAWKVSGLHTGGVASSLPEGTKDEARLTFGEDGTVEGNLGCNSFHGKAAVSGSTITFGPLASTRKMCPGGAMELERALLGAMKGETTYTIAHRTLSLTAKGGEGLDATAPPAGH